MKINDLQHHVLDLIKTRLPSHFYYHNLEHTQYVMNAVHQLAVGEQVLAEELPILMTAAMLHDVGFIATVKGHEERSCAIARDILPSYDYKEEEIITICALIMDTKLPQQVHTPLSRILCDADLYYLGTDQFSDIGDKLFKEMISLNQISSLDDWNELQVQFLSSHHYFTATANRLLYEKKLANLFTLKTRLRHY